MWRNSDSASLSHCGIEEVEKSSLNGRQKEAKRGKPKRPENVYRAHVREHLFIDCCTASLDDRVHQEKELPSPGQASIMIDHDPWSCTYHTCHGLASWPIKVHYLFLSFLFFFFPIAFAFFLSLILPTHQALYGPNQVGRHM